MRKINIIGKTFGRLLALSEENIKYKYMVKCKCECGNIIKVLKHNLIRGNTKSCGCLQKEVVSKSC